MVGRKEKVGAVAAVHSSLLLSGISFTEILVLPCIQSSLSEFDLSVFKLTATDGVHVEFGGGFGFGGGL